MTSSMGDCCTSLSNLYLIVNEDLSAIPKYKSSLSESLFYGIQLSNSYSIYGENMSKIQQNPKSKLFFDE